MGNVEFGKEKCHNTLASGCLDPARAYVNLPMLTPLVDSQDPVAHGHSYGLVHISGSIAKQ